MPQYMALVRETKQRWVVIDAPTEGKAFRTNPSQWDDCGDTPVTIDYAVDDVKGPSLQRNDDEVSSR